MQLAQLANLITNDHRTLSQATMNTLTEAKPLSQERDLELLKDAESYVIPDPER